MNNHRQDDTVNTRRAGVSPATGWLAANVGRPAAAILSSFLARASHRAVVYYRRASTRAAALVLKPLDG
jgi:hypothetical protein